MGSTATPTTAPPPPLTPIFRFNIGVSRLEKQSANWGALSDTHIYWVGGADPGHLWRYPLAGGKSEMVATTQFDQGHLDIMRPSKNGAWLVVMDAQALVDNPPYQLRAFNTTNGTEKLILDGRHNKIAMPDFAVEGDWVVWTAVANFGKPNCQESLLTLYNLTTGEERTLADTCIENEHLWSLPALSGNFVVVEQDLSDSKGGGSNIYLYNLTTKQFTALTSNGQSSMPTISGPWIAWKNGPRYQEVYTTLLYNRQTQVRQVLPMGQDRVVLANQRWLYWERAPISVYDLEKQQFLMVATSGLHDVVGAPLIAGDRIAWVRIPDSATEKFGDTLEWRQLP